MLNKFKEYLEINYHKKETKNSYFLQVKLFYNFCNGNITQEKINQYFIKRIQEGITESTHNKILSSLKVFFKFMEIKYNLPRFKRTNKNMKDYITYNLLKTEILPYISNIFRNYRQVDLLLNTMFFSGLRPSEIINLIKENLDFQKHRIIVKNTKGKIDRFIPFLNKDLELTLKQWTDYSTNNQKIFSFNKRHSLNCIFSKIKNEINLKIQFTPKTMRISFAKYCLSKGLDISIIQKLLGHKDIETTMIYAEPDERLIEEACLNIKI